ncbi:hypothetical protein ACOE72_000785 [Escherichia coli]
MSTIPKERLEQLASGNAWYCVQDDEAAELARIALASLEAEPYGYVHKAAYEKTGSCGLSNDREAYRYSSTHVAVYTAPPAPVSVPAAMEMDDDFDSAFEHGKAVGWNACRAAMLQGAEPPAYEIKRFGEFGANGLTRDDGELAISIQLFHFERGTTPQPVRGGGIVVKYALQAIINALQQQCDQLSAAPIPVIWPAAPQQEVDNG